MKPELGFGTASVLGQRNRRDSLAAISCMLEHGVRHIDTARSYGWGEAEGLIGHALEGIPRDRYILVTKCGYVPIRRTRFLSMAKKVGRQLMSVAPSLRDIIRSAAGSGAFQPETTYDVALLDASVQTSLVELRVSYLDVLILHNFDPQIAGLKPVVAWMKRLKEKSVIREYGFSIGPSFLENLDWLHERGLLEGAIIQAPVSAGMMAVPEQYRDVQVIAHSPFQHTELDIPKDLAELSSLLQRQFRCRAIVCSMFSESHIAANAHAMR